MTILFYGYNETSRKKICDLIFLFPQPGAGFHDVLPTGIMPYNSGS